MFCAPQIAGAVGFTKRCCSCLLHGHCFPNRYSPFHPRNTLCCLSGCRSISSTVPCRKERGEAAFGPQSPLPSSSAEGGCSPLPDQVPTMAPRSQTELEDTVWREPRHGSPDGILGADRSVHWRFALFPAAPGHADRHVRSNHGARAE